MSGAVTGSTAPTIRFRPPGIRRVQKKASEKPRAVVRGGTTSGSHDVRRVPASRLNSNTLTTAFASSAIALIEHSALNRWAEAGITDANWYDEVYELLGLFVNLSHANGGEPS